MPTYARLNEPAVVEDLDWSDDELLTAAREAVSVEGMAEEDYDFDIERHEHHGDAVVYLFTLFEVDPENPLARLTINGDDPHPHTAVEYGDEDYFAHVWDSRAVEGVHTYTEEDN